MCSIMRKDKSLHYTLEASVKRAIRGGVNRKDGDYTMQAINGMLYELLGTPGVSAGKSKLAPVNTMSASSGFSSSAYSSAQQDSSVQSANISSVGSGAIGLLTTLLSMYYNDKAAQTAYNRQNEFYDNHLSMPAKVQEYQDAGLNPMALAGAGAGATSAPSVSPASTPDVSGLTGVLGSLLDYKARMAEVKVAEQKVAVERDDVTSKIEYRAEQKLYQQKINEWFEANQITSLGKAAAETKLALEQVNSEQMKQKLDEAGISEKQANAALSFQLALQKEFENSADFRANTLALQRARANEANANAAQTYEGIKNLAAQRDEITSRIALNYANTDIGKQQLINLGLNEEQIRFAIQHQKGDLIFNRINQVTSSLKDIGIAAGGIAGAATGLSTLAPPAKIIGFGQM